MFRDLISKYKDEMTPISADLMHAAPVVELAGGNRVLIENHRGITSYNDNAICVSVSFGTVQVSGCNLALNHMTDQMLVICGKIDCISIIRRQ